MKKEFVPYEQALALKELGFDEPCLAFFTWKNELKPIKQLEDVFNSLKNSKVNTTYCSSVAPTFSQAFRWFREKHDLMHMIWIGKFTDRIPFYGYDLVLVTNLDYEIEDDGIPSDYKTYEDAEFACLIRMIEIVKNK